MIFRTSCPVLQPQTIFNCKNDLTIRFQMSGYDLKEIHIRSLTLYIGFSIFKHTDQCNIIIFFGKRLLDFLKIPHKDLQIVTVSVSPCIDLASLS